MSESTCRFHTNHNLLSLRKSQNIGICCHSKRQNSRRLIVKFPPLFSIKKTFNPSRSYQTRTKFKHFLVRRLHDFPQPSLKRSKRSTSSWSNPTSFFSLNLSFIHRKQVICNQRQWWLRRASLLWVSMRGIQVDCKIQNATKFLWNIVEPSRNSWDSTSNRYI